MDKNILTQIANAAALTSDPSRAERNLENLFRAVSRENGEFRTLAGHLRELAGLFSGSQFLANFSIRHPDWLAESLGEIKIPLTKGRLLKKAGSQFSLNGPDEVMQAVRLFKKRCLLNITLRDTSGESDIRGSMEELTALAEVIIEAALRSAYGICARRYGEPADKRIALIALGKLGGEELNYSSDVDLAAVYGSADGETSGVAGPSGVMMNRLSNHEFFSKVTELFTRILSANTEEGIAYRVDLRLRPQGQKGEIALPLSAYRAYYEAWGRTWERMVLLRARPVAGDAELGQAFMRAVYPFVWKATSDYSEIEEIRGLKKKIDSVYQRGDIKRGYGGLREAEFFVQTFQLLYGAGERTLRTHRLFNAIQALRWVGLIPERDLVTIWRNYLYLRRLEHWLQMKDDLQTHTVPSPEDELSITGRKMGFASRYDFVHDLRLKRMQIRNMYNSLLGTEKDKHSEALGLLEGDISDEELRGYLAFRGVKDREKGLKDLKGIQGSAFAPGTQRRRELMRQSVPALIEKAFGSADPDRALSGLERFFAAFGMEEAYLTAFLTQKPLSDALIKIFSLSPHLTRIFLSGELYLGLLIEESPIRKSQRRLEAGFEKFLESGPDAEPLSRIGLYKRADEVRLGMYFLSGILGTEDLLRYQSHLAEAVIRAVLSLMGESAGFSIMALGKLGGREMTFGSDADIIFVSESPAGEEKAENAIRALSAYTAQGKLYEIDARLRPEGTKGTLVKDLEGYRRYYSRDARNWEMQALLKARPAAGDAALGRAFLQMARETLIKRGPLVQREEITSMREKIIREHSDESARKAEVDIKTGRGAIEEIEFFTQWKQLQNAANAPEVLVQNTRAALHRLSKQGSLGLSAAEGLLEAYLYYRKLQTFQRLNDDAPLSPESGFAALASNFMGHKDTGEFFQHLAVLREKVLGTIKE